MTNCNTRPDSAALASAQSIENAVTPAKIILHGSRAAGDHRPDSDVDLTAVCPDYATLLKIEGILRELLEGDYTPPVVNALTITDEEFWRTAPLAQSPAGQAVRHGVTPDGRRLNCQPEREPEPREIQQETIFWLTLAETHLEAFSSMEGWWQARTHIAALEAQTALERAFKALLTAGNDPARFSRVAALMWRHFQDTNPVTDRSGAGAMEAMLEATREQDGTRCTLTRFTEAWRRGNIVPDPTETEWQAMTLHLATAVNALVTEALARSGATRKKLQRELASRREHSGKKDQGSKFNGGRESQGFQL